MLIDEKLNPRGTKFDCKKSAIASVVFPAHSSPLGLEHFGGDADPSLRNLFLVALHGSTTKRLSRGYKVQSVSLETGKTQDFLTGFLEGIVVHGRPADIFRTGPNAFFVTDDRAGVIYYIHAEGHPNSVQHKPRTQN